MFDPSTIKVPPHIQNPSAYRAAVARKIQQRQYEARRLKRDAVLAEWLTKPDNMALCVALTEEAAKPRPNQFLAKMHSTLMEWGHLTDGQDAAARKVLRDVEERAKQRLAENAEAAARSRHFGKVKDRLRLKLTLKRKWQMDGYFGPCTGHVFEDAQGNVAVYIGVPLEMEPGDTRSIRATIKGHDVRDGVAQTKINRPVLEDDDDRQSEEEFLASRFAMTGRGAIKL